MRNFKINTVVSVDAPANFKTNTNNSAVVSAKHKNSTSFITRGTNAVISVDISEKVYTFEQIEQMIIIIKQDGNYGKTYTYELYDIDNTGEKAQNSQFKRLFGPGYNYIRLLLSEQDTAKFIATEPNNYLDIEVIVKISSDTDDIIHTMIEQQPSVRVIDSLYGQLLGE